MAVVQSVAWKKEEGGRGGWGGLGVGRAVDLMHAVVRVDGWERKCECLLVRDPTQKRHEQIWAKGDAPHPQAPFPSFFSLFSTHLREEHPRCLIRPSSFSPTHDVSNPVTAPRLSFGCSHASSVRPLPRPHVYIPLVFVHSCVMCGLGWHPMPWKTLRKEAKTKKKRWRRLRAMTCARGAIDRSSTRPSADGLHQACFSFSAWHPHGPGNHDPCPCTWGPT